MSTRRALLPHEIPPACFIQDGPDDPPVRAPWGPARDAASATLHMVLGAAGWMSLGWLISRCWR